jgi:hypothetical protein
MKYLPFIDGKYSTAPGLYLTEKAEQAADRLIFQIDDNYPEYIGNKLSGRKENIHKYYCEKDLHPNTAVTINRYVAFQLVIEHPHVFSLQENDGQYVFLNNKTSEHLQWGNDWVHVSGSIYLTLLDALSSQVQEDTAICQLQGDKDWMAAIHLCSPNHWDAREKIGRSFDAVHAIVPSMEKTIQHYPKMFQSILNKGPFTRFAWGISTDARLNHHPEPPPGVDPIYWYGRKIGQDDYDIFLRVERQNLVGFPDVNAFLFTIRTYFYSVNDLNAQEKNALFAAIETMSEASKKYKGLYGKVW